MTRGKFVTFEGPDGSGKTSVIQAIFDYISIKGHSVYKTREPGGNGSVIAEEIRELILDVRHTNMDPWTEAFLYAGARRQHLTEVILPQLVQGSIVLCDRFVDSSLVYQGVARGLTIDKVKELNKLAVQGNMPELTLLIDVPAEIGLERIYRAKDNRQFDRLDQESLEFHATVRDAFLSLAAEEKRIHIIDGNQALENVIEDCIKVLKQHEIF